MIRALLLVAVLAACGDNSTPNRAPTASSFSLTTQEDLTVTRSIQAEDRDNDQLTTIIALPPDHGTVITNGLMVSYTPTADYHGLDDFAVLISDGEDSASVTVDVTVTPVNDPPIGEPDSIATNEDTPIARATALFLDNDTDADIATDGQTISITAVGGEVDGTVALAGDTITFTPDANFTGTAAFSYTVSDGTESTDVAVSVVVMAVNDPPVAVDDAFATAVDTALVITQAQLLANDTDVDNVTLAVTLVDSATGGTIADNGNDTYTFTPTAGFTGDATFVYTVSDGIATDTGLVTIAVGN